MKARLLLAAASFSLLGIACGKKTETDTKTDPNKQEQTSTVNENEPLFSYEENGLYGYKNAKGAVVIKAQYMMVEDSFTTKATFVMHEKGFSMINKKGEVLLEPFIFDNGPDYLSQDLFRFVENGKIGFANMDGNKVIAATFDFAEPFNEDLAAFCTGCKKEVDGEHYRMVGGKWGFMDKTGKTVIEPQYTDAESFIEGTARVEMGKSSFRIDKTGKKVK